MPNLINGDYQSSVNVANDRMNGLNSRLVTISDDVPILIIGAGPVGLSLSYMLSKFGSKCALNCSMELV